MMCHRLTFQNQHVLEVIIDATGVAAEPRTTIQAASIFRVIDGVREAGPLRRVDGRPIELYAVTEETALAIATEVLCEVSESRLIGISECGGGEFPAAEPSLA